MSKNNCTNIQEIFYNKNYTISIIEMAISMKYQINYVNFSTIEYFVSIHL